MSEYQLIDFGSGRKLERFGRWIFDRPSPAAEGVKIQNPEWWQTANFLFLLENKHKGKWYCQADSAFAEGGTHCLPKGSRNYLKSSVSNRNEQWAKLDPNFSYPLQTTFAKLRIKATEFGHVGLFPEHFQHWNRLIPEVKRATGQGEEFQVLSLFAYTGASSLAMASCGAKVTQVEAAKNTVAWARNNAELSQAQNWPIRWIVEDVPKFVSRELKRGRRYHGIIVDPPTFGHGPKGQRWQIENHLPELLDQLVQLLEENFSFLLLSAHSPGFRASFLKSLLDESFNRFGQQHADRRTLFSGPVGLVPDTDPLTESYPLTSTQNARKLDAGSIVCVGNRP